MAGGASVVRGVARALALLAVLQAAAPPAMSAQVARDRKMSTYDEYFRKYTKRFFGPGYDWRVFKAQAMAESNLRPEATSRVGARGLMQLMPSTFRAVREKDVDPELRPMLRDIHDPESNIAAGIAYDRWLWKRWTEPGHDAERRRFTFGSYNAGRGSILRAVGEAKRRQLAGTEWSHVAAVAPHVRGWRWRETVSYVTRIDSLYAAMDHRGGFR